MAARILLVDNDVFQLDYWATILQLEGYDVKGLSNVDEAIEAMEHSHFDLVVTDLRMSPGSALKSAPTLNGMATGAALALPIRAAFPSTRVIIYSSGSFSFLRPYLRRDNSLVLIERPAEPEQLLNAVEHQLTGKRRQPRIFVVHGRDYDSRDELLEFIQHDLNLGKPIVLAEQPSRGMALIEKFEHYANQTDVAFVLLTPDDLGTLAAELTSRPRARLNVIFELGYFFGYLLRLSGRVFLLWKGDQELPSDIRGMIYIDISAGIKSAESELRRELAEWL
jgi:predicted nucleotide-binding protein